MRGQNSQVIGYPRMLRFNGTYHVFLLYPGGRTRHLARTNGTCVHRSAWALPYEAPTGPAVGGLFYEAMLASEATRAPVIARLLGTVLDEGLFIGARNTAYIHLSSFHRISGPSSFVI